MWKKDLPKEPGIYWFKGRKASKPDSSLSCLLEVAKQMNGSPVYILDSDFFYTSVDSLEGWFILMDEILPPLPNS
jgi:hypothetical protein